MLAKGTNGGTSSQQQQRQQRQQAAAHNNNNSSSNSSTQQQGGGQQGGQHMQNGKSTDAGNSNASSGSSGPVSAALAPHAQIILLDFGLAEELTPRVRRHFVAFLNCIAAGVFCACVCVHACM